MPAWERWFDGKCFTTDWTSLHFDSWSAILGPLQGCEMDILEIGSWEGRSAIFFLEFFKSSRLTCVDTFLGSSEHCGAEFDLASIENRFDENTAGYGSRVEKIKTRSVLALDRLAQDGHCFDLIYIDGSHRREDVMADSALAWKILKQDGLIIWDDFLWGGGGQVPDAERPQRAIEAFLGGVSGEIKILQLHCQVIGQKCSSSDLLCAPNVPRWVFPRTPGNLGRFLLKMPIDILQLEKFRQNTKRRAP